jgi:tripartite-type tricarboxylate transporter receptor subunit TctC
MRDDETPPRPIAPVTRRKALALTAGAAGLALAGPGAGGAAFAQAQEFPWRTVVIVVPYPPGGPTDSLARTIAQEIAPDLRQPVIVENRPGASGSIGTRGVARGEADGHLIVLGNNQTHATNPSLIRDLGYDPQKDFVPLAGLADLQHALVVKKDLPAQTVAELVALAKSKPDALNYGSTGNGSGSHLAMELFKTRTGTKLTHVPFRGAAPMAQEIVAGRIDCAFATLPSVLGLIEGGEMRALAVASPVRAPRVPEVRTLTEQGITGADADSWLALFAPSGVPAAAAARLSGAVLAALQKPAVAKAVADQGMRMALKTPEQMRGFLAAEIGKWSEVIKVAGVKVE